MAFWGVSVEFMQTNLMLNSMATILLKVWVIKIVDLVLGFGRSCLGFCDHCWLSMGSLLRYEAWEDEL